RLGAVRGAAPHASPSPAHRSIPSAARHGRPARAGTAHAPAATDRTAPARALPRPEPHAGLDVSHAPPGLATTPGRAWSRKHGAPAPQAPEYRPGLDRRAGRGGRVVTELEPMSRVEERTVKQTRQNASWAGLAVFAAAVVVV